MTARTPPSPALCSVVSRRGRETRRRIDRLPEGHPGRVAPSVQGSLAQA
jgi:hypothetical protein